MDKTEASIVVDGKVYVIQSAIGKPVKICLDGEATSAEYSTERLLELIDLVRAY